MSQINIEVDATSWLDADGVGVSVFLSDAIAPALEFRRGYTQCVREQLYSYISFGEIQPKEQNKAEEFVLELERTAKYARELYESLKSE